MKRNNDREARRQRARERHKQRMNDPRRSGQGRGVACLKPGIGIPIYKVRDGRNRIVIVPWTVRTNKHPDYIRNGDYPAKGDVESMMDVWVHPNVGPMDEDVLCLANMFGQSCPICEERKDLFDRGDKDNAVPLFPKHRIWYRILDLIEDDGQLQLFDSSEYMFERNIKSHIEIEGDPDLEYWMDEKEGCEIRWHNAKKGKFPDYTAFSLKPHGGIDQELLDEGPSLEEWLVIPTYEQVQKKFFGLVDDEEDQPDDEKESKPSRKESKSEDDNEEGGLESNSELKDDDLEDKPEIEKKRGRRTRKKKEEKETDNQCPNGYRFGHDFDVKSKCGKGDCDDEIFDACGALWETLDDD